ncbi:oligosaccharide flippase family protein [Pseudomonas sp.]|uniref:oligosaccharide flippase family protein n=1 Tax=Pseudomonas sp. TaxID=306 RepID=UPI00299DA30B|nr:oligosaccharide flippase family protein [Pseudomonas sp.]MDX1366005.1 oligosaccharide flippase family protein [Pseudomonas sp.]
MAISKQLTLVLQEFRHARTGDGLRHRAMRASAWTIGGNLTSVAIRLGSNLILTRLLFPEAFGIMAIVQAVMVGLALLTDAGIEPAIIQSKRGHEPVFLNTAWTMQAMQGVLIWLIVCGLSPFVATLYDQPILTSLLPVAALGAVLGGLASTKLVAASRVLNIKTRVLIEVGSYTLGILLTILLALIDRSIWSLVWGGLVGALVKTMASHLLQDGTKNRFAWEWASVKALFGFGQWVIVSSALTFLAGEGSKLLLGAFLGVKLLALFTLASTMSLVFWQVAQQLNSRVFFPAYSEVARERPEHLRAVAVRSRLFLIIPGWLVALFFVLWGDHFMWFLYDPRYAESGPMLQILAMGSLVGVVGGSYNGLLWAKGLVRISTVLLVLQILLQIVGVFIGNYYLGEKGVVLSVALVGWLLYPAQAYVHSKIGLWMPQVDLPFLILSSIVVGCTFSGVIQ